MAVAIATTDRVHLGDVAALDGATAFWTRWTINISAAASGERFCGQWGSLVGNQAFLCQVLNTDEIGFVVRGPGGVLRGRQTSTFNFTTTTYHMLVYYAANTTVEIWVDGVQVDDAAWLETSDITSLNGANTDVALGYEDNTGTDGVDGDYSEWAGGIGTLTAADKVMLSREFSPQFLRSRSGQWYVSLFNTSDTREVWNATTVTHVGTSNAAHPRIFYPGAIQLGIEATAAGGAAHVHANPLRGPLGHPIGGPGF